MNNPTAQNERIAKMKFSTVYPLYLAKVEKKGRTKAELDQVVSWLTGYDEKKIQDLINELEYHARALVNASSVKGKFPYEASRWLPNGTRSDLTTWIGSVVSTLENVIEEADAAL